MTRTLVLLRHGKSEWPAGVPDHERPLSPRGRRQAAEAGRWLAEHVQIDLAIVSPATRARTTWQEAGEPGTESRLDERVYAATAHALRRVVEEADADTVLLVGHNPGMEDLVELLTGEYAEMPTSAIAVIDLDEGTLVHHGRPPA